ncbi:MAG: ankyrin repeat domain-containing protein, partial [Phycisphaerae bacterium]|nr:ankyrin repeat domain-containing protein [Phycisphaerae bacterium]
CGEIPLTLGWNGQKVNIPGPLVWPDAARKTAEFRSWQATGHIQTLRFTDEKGRKWQTKTFAQHMPEITVHRPDGTLLATGMVMGDSGPSNWVFYDAQGKKQVFKVICRSEKKENGDYTGHWNIRNVYFYDSDGTERNWQVNRADVVRGEIITLPSGHAYYARYARPYEDSNKAYTPELNEQIQKDDVRRIARDMLSNAQAGNQDVVACLVLPGSPLAGKQSDLPAMLKGGQFAVLIDKVAIEGNRAQAVATRRKGGDTESWTIRLVKDNGYWLVADMDAPNQDTPSTQPAAEARMTLAKAQLQMEEDHLVRLRQLVSTGRASAREIQEQELKVLQAKVRQTELSQGADSKVASEARMTLAKARLQIEKDHLVNLRRFVSVGRASVRELQEQELKVLQAKVRLAELGGIPSQPATQPGKGAMTPLHEAAAGGHGQTVEVLISSGSDPNARDAQGRTPLHLAARFGHEDVAGRLLRHGADINAADNQGRTPLHEAAAGGHPRLVKFLLAHKAKTTAPATQPAAEADKSAEANRAVRRQLDQNLAKLDFVGIDFKDVVQFLREVSNCPIHVKWNALEAVSVKKNTKVNVHFTNITLRKVLRTVLDDVAGPGKLGFIVEEGVITISTQADLDHSTTQTRVYDIRDLIRLIPDAEPVSLGWPKQKPQPKVKDKEPEPTEVELAEQVVNLIKTTIAPDSWRPKGEIGSIKFLDGQLIITQAHRYHKRILDLFKQLREGRGLSVQVESRFIDVSPLMDKQLTEWLTKQTEATFKKGKWDSFLSDEDVKVFIKETQKSKDVRLLTAPRLTLFNGQRAYVTVASEKKITLPMLDNQDMMFRIPYQTGVLFDVKAAVSANRHYVTSTCTSESAWISRQAGKFETSRAKATATVNVPDEKTVLLRLPFVRHRPIGFRQVRDPAGGKTFSEVVEEPIPGQPQRYVYVLIKPRIIIQREYEEIKPPALRSASQTTTHPATKTPRGDSGF